LYIGLSEVAVQSVGFGLVIHRYMLKNFYFCFELKKMYSVPTFLGGQFVWLHGWRKYPFVKIGSIY
jgi:hypothetical protein